MEEEIYDSTINDWVIGILACRLCTADCFGAADPDQWRRRNLPVSDVLEVV